MILNKGLFQKLMEDYEKIKYFSINYSYDVKEKDLVREIKETFEEERSIGGTHQDCWGGESKIDESFFDECSELEKFLEKKYKLTKIQMKMLVGLYSYERRTRHQDYYGGSYEIEVKKVTIEDLSEALVVLGLEENDNNISIEDYVKDFNLNREKNKEIAWNKIKAKKLK